MRRRAVHQRHPRPDIGVLDPPVHRRNVHDADLKQLPSIFRRQRRFHRLTLRLAQRQQHIALQRLDRRGQQGRCVGIADLHPRPLHRRNQHAVAIGPRKRDILPPPAQRHRRQPRGEIQPVVAAPGKPRRRSHARRLRRRRHHAIAIHQVVYRLHPLHRFRRIEDALRAILGEEPRPVGECHLPRMHPHDPEPLPPRNRRRLHCQRRRHLHQPLHRHPAPRRLDPRLGKEVLVIQHHLVAHVGRKAVLPPLVDETRPRRLKAAISRKAPALGDLRQVPRNPRLHQRRQLPGPVALDDVRPRAPQRLDHHLRRLPVRRVRHDRNRLAVFPQVPPSKEPHLRLPGGVVIR